MNRLLRAARNCYYYSRKGGKKQEKAGRKRKKKRWKFGGKPVQKHGKRKWICGKRSRILQKKEEKGRKKGAKKGRNAQINTILPHEGTLRAKAVKK